MYKFIQISLLIIIGVAKVSFISAAQPSEADAHYQVFCALQQVDKEFNRAIWNEAQHGTLQAYKPDRLKTPFYDSFTRNALLISCFEKQSSNESPSPAGLPFCIITPWGRYLLSGCLCASTDAYRRIRTRFFDSIIAEPSKSHENLFFILSESKEKIPYLPSESVITNKSLMDEVALADQKNQAAQEWFSFKNKYRKENHDSFIVLSGEPRIIDIPEYSTIAQEVHAVTKLREELHHAQEKLDDQDPLKARIKQLRLTCEQLYQVAHWVHPDVLHYRAYLKVFDGMCKAVQEGKEIPDEPGLLAYIAEVKGCFEKKHREDIERARSAIQEIAMAVK
jgi:hypothetical protein